MSIFIFGVKIHTITEKGVAESVVRFNTFTGDPYTVHTSSGDSFIGKEIRLPYMNIKIASYTANDSTDLTSSMMDANIFASHDDYDGQDYCALTIDESMAPRRLSLTV